MKSKQQKYLEIFENCDYFVDLGLHIAYYRRQAGMTQQQLADELKITRPYLSRIESANWNQPFSFELFFNICRVLAVEPENFFAPLPEPDPKK